MKILTIVFVVAGCWSIQWIKIKDFKAYWTVSVNTLSSIQSFQDASRFDPRSFVKNTYLANPVAKKIMNTRSCEDECLVRFIDEDNLKYFFDNKIHRLQIPLRNRLVEIRQMLDKINTSIHTYEKLAGIILRNCHSLLGCCSDEIKQRLRSIIYSLRCNIYLNCMNINSLIYHYVTNKTICHPHLFSYEYGNCFAIKFFCDGECNCAEYSDEPKDRVKYCSIFRCIKTFLCILNSTMCNGINGCRNGIDEEECLHTTIKKVSDRNCDCLIDLRNLLCINNMCVGQKNESTEHNYCSDWNCQSMYGKSRLCFPEDRRKGGVSFTRKIESIYLYECHPETYKTPQECGVTPTLLPTLIKLLEETLNLKKFFEARLMYFTTRTIKAISQCFEEVISCLKCNFSTLSLFHSPVYKITSIWTSNRSAEKSEKESIIDKNWSSSGLTYSAKGSEEGEDSVKKSLETSMTRQSTKSSFSQNWFNETPVKEKLFNDFAVLPFLGAKHGDKNYKKSKEKIIPKALTSKRKNTSDITKYNASVGTLNHTIYTQIKMKRIKFLFMFSTKNPITITTPKITSSLITVLYLQNGPQKKKLQKYRERIVLINYLSVLSRNHRLSYLEVKSSKENFIVSGESTVHNNTKSITSIENATAIAKTSTRFQRFSQFEIRPSQKYSLEKSSNVTITSNYFIPSNDMISYEDDSKENGEHAIPTINKSSLSFTAINFTVSYSIKKPISTILMDSTATRNKPSSTVVVLSIPTTKDTIIKSATLKISHRKPKSNKSSPIKPIIKEKPLTTTLSTIFIKNPLITTIKSHPMTLDCSISKFFMKSNKERTVTLLTTHTTSSHHDSEKEIPLIITRTIIAQVIIVTTKKRIRTKITKIRRKHRIRHIARNWHFEAFTYNNYLRFKSRG